MLALLASGINEASLFCLILFVGLPGSFPIFRYNSSQRILF